VTFTVSIAGGNRLRITVADTGTGIPLDKQNKLFQPFQRAGQEAGPIQGTGIGLVIAKRLAELMNGSVGFRSAPGEGSEFWVDMPVHLVAVSLPEAARPESDLSVDLHSVGQRLVLYVEDNPANVIFMTDLLSAFENIELVSTLTAEMGIELACARKPAVIIMDINLPGLSGLDALRTLQRIPETRGTPVIALTAAASERDRERGERAGFYRYLTKPVNVEELEGALGAVLGSDV
jgi:CheY-like chemotaxis protein